MTGCFTTNELLTQTLKTKSIEESRNKQLNLIKRKKETLESLQKETSSNLVIIQEEIDASPSSNNLENLIGSYSSLLLKQLEINLSLAELEEELDMQDFIYTVIEDYTVQPYQRKEGRVFIGAGIAVTFLLLILILIELNKFFLKRSYN